jgi:glycosyl transferase, family 25
MSNKFQSLNEYFDKILVLTLPRLQQRMDDFRRVFTGLEYDFFYGLDKQDTSLDLLKQKGEYDTAAYRRFYKKPTEISLGMLCCSIGHLMMYEYIVAKGFQRTLIFEDDAVPLPEHLDRFPVIVKELPADWDVLYLGYEKNENLGLRERVKRSVSMLWPNHAQLHMNRQLFRRYYPEPVSAHVAKAGFHDCTHAYAITLDGARKLLQHRRPVRFHPDNLISYAIGTGEINGYICRPKLFSQLSAFTNSVDSLTAN